MGVVPVTAVVTEVADGPEERATVHFLGGRAEEVGVGALRGFVAEGENPENRKQVRSVAVELPSLERFRGLRFVDMPGLESALAHNTEETLRWLPAVGLALVAVSIDTPLSHHDLELLKGLYRYTPNVSILLTKAALLDEGERAEVLSFIREQLTSVDDLHVGEVIRQAPPQPDGRAADEEDGASGRRVMPVGLFELPDLRLPRVRRSRLRRVGDWPSRGEENHQQQNPLPTHTRPPNFDPRNIPASVAVGLILTKGFCSRRRSHFDAACRSSSSSRRR